MTQPGQLQCPLGVYQVSRHLEINNEYAARSKSDLIQFETFHVIRACIANPDKSEGVLRILRTNNQCITPDSGQESSDLAKLWTRWLDKTAKSGLSGATRTLSERVCGYVA